MILFKTWLVSTQCRSIMVSRQGLRITVYFEQKNPDKHRVFDTYRDFPGLPGLEPLFFGACADSVGTIIIVVTL